MQAKGVRTFGSTAAEIVYRGATLNTLSSFGLIVFITRCVLKGDVSVYEGYRIGGEYFALFIAVFSTTGSASVIRKPKKCMRVTS